MQPFLPLHRTPTDAATLAHRRALDFCLNYRRKQVFVHPDLWGIIDSPPGRNRITLVTLAAWTELE
jgi:hypothetical protein